MTMLFLIQFLLKKTSHCVYPLMSDFLKEAVLDLLDPDVLVHVFDRGPWRRNPPRLFIVTSPDQSGQPNCTQRVKCHLT